jgi:hypothetical protein
MNIQRNETQILFNVLTGGIKILSKNGRFDYGRISEFDESPDDRIKFMIGLLKIIRKLKARQATLTEARKKLIEVQINSQRH